jgi:hypothetical protein
MSFSINQYFPFDRQWIALFFKYIQDNPDLFVLSNRENTQYKLGLGIRKIESLGDWVIKLGLAKKLENKYYLSELGKLILLYDRTIEEKGTWLIMHYNISSRKENLEICYWLFNIYNRTKFSLKDIKEDLLIYKPNLSERSINNSIGLIINQYINTQFSKDLKIITEVERGLYFRPELSENILDTNILAYTILDWAINNKRYTVNLDELYMPGAPGRIFNINKKTLNNYLDFIQKSYNKNLLWVSRTANLNSISFNIKINYIKILEIYYKEKVEGKKIKNYDDIILKNG